MAVSKGGSNTRTRHPFAVKLDSKLAHDYEVLEKHYLVPWLLSFASKQRLELDDLRGGKIVCEGVAFSGSVSLVFDQQITRLLHDQSAEILDTLDQELGKSRSKSEIISLIKSSEPSINAHLGKIWHRAAYIKRKLLKQSEATVLLGPNGKTSVSNELHALKRHYLLRLGERENPFRLAWQENRGPFYFLLSTSAFLLSVVALVISLTNS